MVGFLANQGSFRPKIERNIFFFFSRTNNFRLVYIFIDFQAILQPTKSFLQPTKYFHRLLFRRRRNDLICKNPAYGRPWVKAYTGFKCKGQQSVPVTQFSRYKCNDCNGHYEPSYWTHFFFIILKFKHHYFQIKVLF